MIIIFRKKYETYIRSIKSFIKKYKGKEMNKVKCNIGEIFDFFRKKWLR